MAALAIGAAGATRRVLFATICTLQAVARAGVQRHRLQMRITTLAIISSAVMAMVNIRTSTVARFPTALFYYLESARNKIDGR